MNIPNIPMIIDGKPVASTSGVWVDVLNPATQDVVAKVPFATLEEVDTAVASAKEAFKSWRKVSVAKRQAIMLRFQQLVRDNTQ